MGPMTFEQTCELNVLVYNLSSASADHARALDRADAKFAQVERAGDDIRDFVKRVTGTSHVGLPSKG